MSSGDFWCTSIVDRWRFPDAICESVTGENAAVVVEGSLT